MAEAPEGTEALHRAIQATHAGIVKLAQLYLAHEEATKHQAELPPETVYQAAVDYRNAQKEVEALVTAEVNAHIEFYRRGGPDI